jgi:Xaa-Pro aminopeptidase
MLGCQDGFANISRSTRQPIMRPATDDVINQEDVITFDWEFVGPHGYGLELSGHYSFGPPPDKIQRLYDVQKETYQRCVEIMRPGNTSRMIRDTIEATYKKHGFSLPTPAGYGPVQYHAHGIGLDFSEPPFVPEQDITLEEGMVLALHPHIGPEDRTIPPIEILDNVLVTPHGGERLSYSQVEWVQL